jgi:hypothetical protein
VASYKFVTQWRFDAPVERVWDEIYHSERWPEWWKAVKSVVPVAPGNREGVGAVRRYTWRGVLPYRLSFEMRTSQVQELSLLEGHAVGELTGRGCWYFSADGAGTAVRYDWEVETTRPWMRLMAPIARPLFEWNHDTVMRWGFEGLTRRLRDAGQ